MGAIHQSWLRDTQKMVYLPSIKVTEPNTLM